MGGGGNNKGEGIIANHLSFTGEISNPFRWEGGGNNQGEGMIANHFSLTGGEGGGGSREARGGGVPMDLAGLPQPSSWCLQRRHLASAGHQFLHDLRATPSVLLQTWVRGGGLRKSKGKGKT